MSGGKTHRRTPSFLDRLGSFSEWPPTAQQTKEDLAGAGFRYTHVRDKVKCDACGGKLYNWRASDDPVVQHLRYFPDCEYVTRMVDSKNERASSLEKDGCCKPNGGAESRWSVGIKSVDDGWLKEQLDRPPVQIVVSRGHGEEVVKRAIVERFQETGGEFKDAPNLLKAVYKLQDRMEEEERETEERQKKEAEDRREREKEEAEERRRREEAEERQKREEELRSAARASSLQERDGPRGALQCDAVSTPPKQTKKGTVCVICQEREQGAMFLPCSHLCVCPDCAVKVNTCPVCNKSVQHRLRVYLG